MSKCTVDDVHDLRVEVKKLRSLFRLFSTTKHALRIPGAMRRVYRAAGTLRDLQLCTDVLHHVERVRQPLQQLHAALASLQTLAVMELERSIHAYDAGAARATCLRRLPLVAQRSRVHEGMSRLTERITVIMDTGARRENDLHTLRIRCKDLMYAARTMSDVFNDSMISDEEESLLHDLTQELGSLQDRRKTLALISPSLAASIAEPERSYIRSVRSVLVTQKEEARRHAITSVRRARSVIVSIALLPLLLAIGCSTSNVYDPSLALPAQPLSSRQMQASVSAGMLPQTRPEAASQAISVGASGTVRFAPASWLTLQGRYWVADAAYAEGVATGISTSAIIRLDGKEEGWRWSLLPTYAWTFGGSASNYALEGQGGALMVAAWLPAMGDWRPYAGMGPAYGWNELDGERHGWAGILNVGTHYMLGTEFSVYAELTTIGQVNHYDGIAHLLFSPILGVAYAF